MTRKKSLLHSKERIKKAFDPRTLKICKPNIIRKYFNRSEKLN